MDENSERDICDRIPSVSLTNIRTYAFAIKSRPTNRTERQQSNGTTST